MEYEVFQDANDILIKKGTSELVILVSKKMAYIKTRNGYKYVNAKTLGSFFSGLETGKLETGVRWLPVIIKGVDGMRMLEKICERLGNIKPMIDRGLFITPEDTNSSATWYDPNPVANAVDNHAIFTDVADILREFVNQDFIGKITGYVLIRSTPAPIERICTPLEIKKMKKAMHILCSFKTCYSLYSAFGYNGGRGIIRAIMQDDTMEEVPNLENLVPNHQNKYKLQWERVAQYLTSGRIAQGYAADEENFITDWTDTLNMSYTVHAKIINGIEQHRVPKDEKYPNYLKSLHEHYQSIIHLYSEHNDPSLYATRKEECPHYQYTTKNKVYIFRMPDSDADMIDEARQMDNCLAGYTTRHATGETTIVFMRYAAYPDKSLVTIERRDDMIIQKRRAHNNPVTFEEDKAIAEWLRETTQAKLIEMRVQQEVERRLKEAAKADQPKEAETESA